MFQYKETNGKGSETTTPMFYNDMPFYSPMGVILVELQDGNVRQIVETRAVELDDKEDLDLMQQFMRLCEDQSRLMQHLEDRIKELQQQSADYEQELYEKDLHLQRESN